MCVSMCVMPLCVYMYLCLCVYKYVCGHACGGQMQPGGNQFSLFYYVGPWMDPRLSDLVASMVTYS